jgi:hypothetical protein
MLEANKRARVKLSGPFTTSTFAEALEERVTPKELFALMATAPLLLTLNSVVVALAVEEAIENRFLFVSPLLAWIESLANGEVVPTPTLPPEVAKYAEPVEEIWVVDA